MVIHRFYMCSKKISAPDNLVSEFRSGYFKQPCRAERMQNRDEQADSPLYPHIPVRIELAIQKAGGKGRRIRMQLILIKKWIAVVEHNSRIAIRKNPHDRLRVTFYEQKMSHNAGKEGCWFDLHHQLPVLCPETLPFVAALRQQFRCLQASFAAIAVKDYFFTRRKRFDTFGDF